MTTSSIDKVTGGQVCTFCRSALRPEEVHLGQPFISARHLVAATATTAMRAPALLGDILFKELDKVPYCPTCRDVLAEKRTAEQLKFLLAILFVLALLIAVPLYLMLAS